MEEGAHSSGYNLRKRKEVNYREARKYKTTATILYQYGKVPKTKKEDLMASFNQEEAVKPKDMFKRCWNLHEPNECQSWHQETW